MVDLPGELMVGEEDAASGVWIGEQRVKMRGAPLVANTTRQEQGRLISEPGQTWELEKNNGERGDAAKAVKHYDADGACFYAISFSMLC